MRYFLIISLALLSILGCKSGSKPTQKDNSTLSLAFGSCNRHNLPNKLWDDVIELGPDAWIWGGDIIYADTDNMERLRRYYTAQKQVPGYKELASNTLVVGTWDDHDYGLNDGGADFPSRARSQREFLDFMEAGADDVRRSRAGIYTTHELAGGKVKLIILDTRYFRSPLIPDTLTSKRYSPKATGTVLGEAQWAWLEAELRASGAQFNIIVSSIQVLSNQHGFETWGNFPSERERLLNLITESGAKGVIILSGDRHISEFSVYKNAALPYPLVDFTSSGLTHAYSNFTAEPNPYRTGKVVAKESFGFLNIDPGSGKVEMQIIGDGGEVLERFSQQY